jgi:hypothetical protein
LQDEQLIFLTDPLTYAESVATAEAGGTHPEVRYAVGLLATSNALSSGKRHDLPRALATHWKVAKVVCDTTHCAVFRTEQPSLAAQTWQKFRGWWRDLLWVEGLNARIGQDPGWIAFANGGDKPWEVALAAEDIAARLHVSSVLDLSRERLKNGAVMIRATSTTDVTALSCEIFRSKLKLLSCPEGISYNSLQRKWRFSGRGEGHGEGFSILEADRDAQAGLAMRDLLRKAFNIGTNDRLPKNKG